MNVDKKNIKKHSKTVFIFHSIYYAKSDRGIYISYVAITLPPFLHELEGGIRTHYTRHKPLADLVK